MKKVWYKQKAAWLWIAAVLILTLVVVDAITYHSVQRTTNPDGSAVMTNHDESTSSPKKSVRLSYHNYKYTKKQTYQINSTVKGWEDYANIRIKDITVYKLAKTYHDVGIDDKKGNCLILINLDTKAKQDVSLYPTQGSLSTNLGQQTDVMDGTKESWDGDMDKGTSKSGDVAAVFTNVNNISDIKKLRYKFEAYVQDENNDSDDAEHDFDLNLKLKPSQS